MNTSIILPYLKGFDITAAKDKYTNIHAIILVYDKETANEEEYVFAVRNLLCEEYLNIRRHYVRVHDAEFEIVNKCLLYPHTTIGDLPAGVVSRLCDCIVKNSGLAMSQEELDSTMEDAKQGFHSHYTKQLKAFLIMNGISLSDIKLMDVYEMIETTQLILAYLEEQQKAQQPKQQQKQSYTTDTEQVQTFTFTNRNATSNNNSKDSVKEHLKKYSYGGK
jgi:hypothetical protein